MRAGPGGMGTPWVSRGRLNIATCLLTGSIDTTIRVSVLNVPSPGRWSAPMSRMFRRSLPSHGGIDTCGRALPAGVSSGTGESVGPAAVPSSSLGVGVAAWPGDGVASSAHSLSGSLMKMQPLSRKPWASMSYRATTTWLPAITRTIAMRPAIDSGLRADPRPACTAVARGVGGVEERGHPIGVDDRDQPVDEDREVDEEDRVEDRRVDQEPEQGDPVDAEDGPGRERQQEDRPSREGQRAERRAGVQLTETGEDEREESSRERRPRARSRALRFVHRG